MKSKEEELLIDWYKSVRISHTCFSQLAADTDTLNRRLGLVSTILSAVVASTIFTTLTQSDKIRWLLVTGLFSIITIIVSSAYQYLKLPELSVCYHQAVNLCGELRHKIEIVLSEADEHEITSDMLNNISHDWDTLSKKVPSIPKGLYEKVKHKILAKKITLIEEEEK